MKASQRMAPHTLAAVGPARYLDEELAWFFCAEDGDFSSQSTFGRMFVPVTEDGEWRTPEDHAVARDRHRRVRTWLRAMPDRDAGILQCAYLPRPWPVVIAKALGRLTGIVVRLSCDWRTWPEARGEQLAVDLGSAERLAGVLEAGDAQGRMELRALRREAEAILARAVRRYESTRRGSALSERA